MDMDRLARMEQAKKVARAEVKKRLEALDAEERSARSLAACRRMEEMDAFARAAVVMLYVPLPSELDVTSLAQRCLLLEKTLCVPRMDWGEMRMAAIQMDHFDDRDLRISHGVREPSGGVNVAAKEIDLVVCPGLAFDRLAHRLGRGGGVYDRFLAQEGFCASTVGIAFDVQVLDEVPVLGHDIALDAVVTELRTIIPRGSER